MRKFRPLVSRGAWAQMNRQRVVCNDNHRCDEPKYGTMVQQGLRGEHHRWQGLVHLLERVSLLHLMTSRRRNVPIGQWLR